MENIIPFMVGTAFGISLITLAIIIDALVDERRMRRQEWPYVLKDNRRR